jgi:hypothetical protein
MHRIWRILILLLVLALVAGMTVGERAWVRSWSRPLDVAIYPVAVDEASRAYVEKLRPGDFQEVAAFLAAEGQRWRRQPMPAPRITLQAPVRELPPAPDAQSRLDAVRSSLRLRWYAFRNTPFWGSLGTVRLFVLYHELKYNEALPHSLGMQKGLLGVVHVFASDEQRAQNNVVIAHELLHTVGATDKYDAAGQPIYPIGFADAYAEPRYPQFKAEIMGGRVPITPGKSEIPRSLEETVVGYATAAEVGW